MSPVAETAEKESAIDRKLRKIDLGKMSQNEAISEEEIRRAFVNNPEELKKKEILTPGEKLMMKDCQKQYGQWRRKIERCCPRKEKEELKYYRQRLADFIQKGSESSRAATTTFKSYLRLVITNPKSSPVWRYAIKLLSHAYPA